MDKAPLCASKTIWYPGIVHTTACEAHPSDCKLYIYPEHFFSTKLVLHKPTMSPVDLRHGVPHWQKSVRTSLTPRRRARCSIAGTFQRRLVQGFSKTKGTLWDKQ